MRAVCMCWDEVSTHAHGSCIQRMRTCMRRHLRVDDDGEHRVAGIRPERRAPIGAAIVCPLQLVEAQRIVEADRRVQANSRRVWGDRCVFAKYVASFRKPPSDGLKAATLATVTSGFAAAAAAIAAVGRYGRQLWRVPRAGRRMRWQWRGRRRRRWRHGWRRCVWWHRRRSGWRQGRRWRVSGIVGSLHRLIPLK